MPRPDLLETFPNPYPDREYEIAMETAEFTSLCPLGGIEGDATDLRALVKGVLHDHLHVARKALDATVLPGAAGVPALELLRG